MDTMPPPVSPSDEKYSSQKSLWVFLGMALVLATGITSFAAYKGYLHLDALISSAGVGKQSLVSVVADFPNLSDIRGVEPDSTDNRLFWLFNYAGVIMQINVETKGIVDYSRRIHETDITDLVRVGSSLFIGLQGGGVLEYNLDTGAMKRYTEDNGLVSNNNILITPDPSDADVLWIGTFYGLNKLTISSGRIDTFQSEMGIPSSRPRTSIQPVVFHVDSRYVWVTIGANAFTGGGVARLDKGTGTWKSWGYEKFAAALQSSRFDTYGAAADGERAVVEESGNIYSYDAAQDAWLSVLASRQSDPGKTNFSLKGNHAYYISAGVPKELNIDTGVERDFLDPAMLANNSVSIDTFGKMTLGMNLDQLKNRMILYPQTGSRAKSSDVIGILPLDGSNKFDIFPFTAFDARFGLINVNLQDAHRGDVLLNASDRLITYDVAKNASRTLLSYPVNVAKIVGSKVVALNLAQCDMECPPELTASSTVISLDTGAIDFTATLKNVQTSAYHIGNSLDEIYLFENKYTLAGSEYQGYKLDVAKESLERVSTTTFSSDLIPNEYSKYSGESADGSYTISFDPKAKNGVVTLTVQRGTASSTDIRIQFNPVSRTSPFGSYDQTVHLSNYAFNSLHPDIVWIGTDHGLIRLNMLTLKYSLFTTNEGLFSNKITRVAVTDTDTVVEHSGGVYIYQFPNL
ncbi:MAG: hypothetical protein NUV90_03455 [Candidatus Parcubacteria bacterium]|nr:hypothetical protein [Candidatus Parcubacteria bacterium]